jgi:hypothetical protein
MASDQCYGLVPADRDRIDYSLEEKFDFYQYPAGANPGDWVADFEKKLTPYHRLRPHWQLPANSYSIWLQHPSYALVESNLHGAHNNSFQFFIDPSRRFEWTVLNALYKNSFLDSKWLEQGERMLNDDDFVKLDLNDIVDSEHTLDRLICSVCDRCGIDIKDANRKKIQQLWHQWKQTTLPESRFESFKKQIGFRL